MGHKSSGAQASTGRKCLRSEEFLPYVRILQQFMCFVNLYVRIDRVYLSIVPWCFIWIRHCCAMLCTLWTTPMLHTIQEAIRLAGVDIRRLRLIECTSSFGLRLRVAIHINLNPLGLDWDSYVYSMLRIAHDALDLDGHSNTIRLSPCALPIICHTGRKL